MEILFQKKNKKFKKSTLVFTLCFLFIYFFIFPYPLQKELRIQINWVLNILKTAEAEKAGSDNNVTESAYIFTLGEDPGDYFGYFNKEGDLIFLKQIEFKDNVPYRVTVSDQGFIYYPITYSDLIFRDERGEEKRIYHNPGPGFPFLTERGDRFFLIRTDLSGLKELNEAGETLWSSSVPSWITTLSYSADQVMCGLGDGTVYLFDKQGVVVSSFSFPKSKINCLYGSALCKQKPLLAGIAGAQPQYLFIGEIREKEKPSLLLIPLDSDFRREVRIRFSRYGELLFFEGERAINIFEMSAKELISLPLLGNITSFAYTDKIGLLAVTSEQNNVHELLILKPKTSLYFKDYFNAQKLFLIFDDDRLFIGIDNKIIRFDLLEE